MNGTGTGIALAAAAAGTISGNEFTAAAMGISIAAAFTGAITSNDIDNAAVGISYQAAAPLGDNRIHDNVTGIESTVLDSSNGFGFVGTALPNQIFDNQTGVNLADANMQNQDLSDNAVGVSGSGFLGGSNPDDPNVLAANTVTVNFTGPIEYNQITRENIGISASSGELIAYNVFYDNIQSGVAVTGQTAVSILNNTFFAPTGDNVDITGGSSQTELLNNIFWAESGYDINVANDSQTGYSSDYNDLYSSGAGKLVHWDIDFTDILDWQDDVDEFDLHSEGTTALNPTLNQPRFAGLSINDFQVIGLFAALRSSSPTINAADPITDEALPAIYQNLLTNPDFSSGLTGWTATPSGGTQSANPAPWTGNDYFFAGPNAVVTLDQTVNLTASGLTDANIDTGAETLIFGGRDRSANETPADSGSISLTFYDSSGDVISTTTEDAQNLSTRWELVGGRVDIPVGARTARYRFTAVRNSGSTNDAYLDAAFVYVQSDSAALDQGAYGAVSVQSGATQPPTLRLISPDLYTDWLDTVQEPIRWESLGNTTNAPVRIDLYQDGANGPQFLMNITPSTPDTGVYQWIAADSGIDFGTHGLRIQISLVGSTSVFDRSTEDFTVPEKTTTYYVNDSGTFGDIYTSAPGSNRNDGTNPSEPVPYVNNLLHIFTLGPGDTVDVDAGNYDLVAPLVVSGITGNGSQSGFTITGPGGTGLPATFILANPLADAPVITLDDAAFMTVEDLTLSGGSNGLLVENNSTNLIATNLTFSDNFSDGLLVEASPAVTIENDQARDNGGAGIRILTGSNVLAMNSISAIGNKSYGIYVDSSIPLLSDCISTFNGGDGINLADANGTLVQDCTASDNAGSGIVVNQSGSTQSIVGGLDLTQGLGNIVASNSADGISVSGNVLVEGNVVSGSTGLLSAGLYLYGGASATSNDIFGNETGVNAYSGNGAVYANRIYDNADDGISVTGDSPVYDNVIYSNGTGIALGFEYSAEVNNNLIYANTSQGILAESGPLGGFEIVNNTIYEPAGDGVDILDQSKNVQLRNNIIWVQSGFDISVATDSQTGFASDYNILYTSGTGQVGLWQGIARATLAAWQDADFSTDADSCWISNPLFVNPLGSAGVAGYISPTDDGRDNDFHEQSLQGSDHGGSLAPVLSAATGLPVFPIGTFTADANESPAIDMGNASDSFANEPAPNGGYINIGAYGDTPEASESLSQYLLVTRPGSGGEIWPEGQTFNITWRFDLAPVSGTTPPAGTVNILLLEQGNTTPVLTIASGVPNSGEYSWTLPTSIAAGSNYLDRSAERPVTRGSPGPARNHLRSPAPSTLITSMTVQSFPAAGQPHPAATATTA